MESHDWAPTRDTADVGVSGHTRPAAFPSSGEIPVGPKRARRKRGRAREDDLVNKEVHARGHTDPETDNGLSQRKGGS